MRCTRWAAVAIALLAPGFATAAVAGELERRLEKLPCSGNEKYQAIVWQGTQGRMTAQQLAAYCAPILWFSPDEPSLGETSGRSIRVPCAFPFEAPADSPVVYFRLRTILATPGAGAGAFTPDPADRSQALIDLGQVEGLELDYFFYYPSEEGFGGHTHDVESVEMKIAIWNRPKCPENPHGLVIVKIVGKAHGVFWYDNTLDVDGETKFPISILVEEGKHASCTDKNGDGYYTPGYDVNKRVNDAWGVRDIIRGGGLYTGGFQSWFAKVRKPEDRVFPPLPNDSPLRRHDMKGGEYAPDHAHYTLRPFPPADRVVDDPHLVPFIADKGKTDAIVLEPTDPKRLRNWLREEPFVKSLAIAARFDGDLGISFVFPLFIVRNFSDPIAGGWLVNRIYLKDHSLRDFGYDILYSTSASRWIDGYFSLGYEADKNDAGDTRRYWVAETGFKFRADLEHSKLRPLAKITPFWGMRAGLAYKGLLPVRELGFVIELGAGTW